MNKLVDAMKATVREIEATIAQHGDNGLLGMRLRDAKKALAKAEKDEVKRATWGASPYGAARAKAVYEEAMARS